MTLIGGSISTSAKPFEKRQQRMCTATPPHPPSSPSFFVFVGTAMLGRGGEPLSPDCPFCKREGGFVFVSFTHDARQAFASVCIYIYAGVCVDREALAHKDTGVETGIDTDTDIDTDIDIDTDVDPDIDTDTDTDTYTYTDIGIDTNVGTNTQTHKHIDT